MVGYWRKSSFSFSNGNCAEVTSWRRPSCCQTGECAEVAAWRKSSFCEGGACAEVGQDGAVVGVRDTKLEHSPVLVFSAEAWQAFTVRIRQGVLRG